VVVALAGLALLSLAGGSGRAEPIGLLLVPARQRVMR
jgi:hypothetical protein